ncbi:MAG: DMT family transporter [Promethearchaeota archaeon]|nr:MAG: DMT family transporter [Candidatus Lokiarchaeota archaeon]
MLGIYFLLILMIIVWSFSFIVVDIALDFAPPLTIALYRYVIASLSFLIIDLYLKIFHKSDFNEEKKDINDKFSRNDWIFLIVASFTGITLFFYAQYNAINLIGPSLPALFVCLLAPVIISFLALFIFDEKLSNIKIIGFIIASFGAFFLITGGNLGVFAPESALFLGYLLALMTPLLWAIYSISTKKIRKERSNFKILKYISYMGTIQLFIFVVLNEEFLIFISNLLNIVLILCSLYLGLGCYVLGFYIWQSSQKKIDSSKVASFLYVEPFITLAFAFLLQRSGIIFLWNILGGIIVLVAVLIINYK